MFDTIHVNLPLICPNCGVAQGSFQTKQFGCVLADYRMGSVIDSSPVRTGIIKERLWCSDCQKAGRPDESAVFIVLWHTVLAGVAQDEAQAEARLASVDRLDLIGWLDDAQRDAQRWRRRYQAFHLDIRRWHEHLARAAAPEPADEEARAAERRRSLASFFDLPEEILRAPDPLGAILATHEVPRDPLD